MEKGYVSLVAENDDGVPGRVWILPIFTVKNHNKPGKVRLVWGAAAEFQGVSLFKKLLAIPDLTASLVLILLRFRVGIENNTYDDYLDSFHREGHSPQWRPQHE